MTVIRNLLFVYIFLVAPFTQAITLVEIQANPAQGWGGKVGVSFAGKSGNNDKEEYDVGLLMRHRRDDRVWMLIADYGYGESNNEKDENDASVHTRWIERDLLSKNWDLEAFAQWQYDDFKDLSQRRLAGGGVRWRFNEEHSNGAFSCNVGIGLFYEDEESRWGPGDIPS